ncbi:patatin-like protein 2 isoform X2 [Gossypium australe]|uniref:Patatin-like protein 2 isoform X2 n=1 Tax=Gossypium australe TaxID=47621 RepID=A0A5B6WTS7_9ROSI|nr:patatin-like protein 2 isoform X2 [Gossypium australe]
MFIYSQPFFLPPSPLHKQAADVLRCRSKTREVDISAESYMKLKQAEVRLADLKSSMMVLGGEAFAAMLSAEDQQQKITFQLLLAMYPAHKAAKWGVLGWLTSEHSSPLIDVFMQASSDMVDFHLATVFRALHSEHSYLRIQDDTLSGAVTSVLDISTKENLENLVKRGEELLKKPVSRVNLETGKFEPVDQGTNEAALIRLAEVLSEEKRLREMRSPHGSFNEEHK